jgi:peptidoglycan/xylan/chitin deacetylase (PgdA/CDA1 family)
MMVRAQVLTVALMSTAFTLTGCGGGGGSDTHPASSASVSPSTDSSSGTNTSTGSNVGTGTTTGTAAGAGTCAAATSGGTCSGSGTGTGSGTGSGTDTGADSGCHDIFTKCFDVSAVQVAKYRQNKQAAASYTFDDGYASSSTIATIFEKYTLRATFFINPGNVPDAQWDMWRGLASKGHEIGNHSMTHTIDLSGPTVTDQTLDTEINGAQKLLEQKMGSRPLSFAFPWHAYSDRSLAVAYQHHFAVRLKDTGESNYHFVFFDQDHSVDEAHALADANAQLADTAATGGWFVAAGHGIDGDGWSPITSNFLNQHLTFAAKYADKIWTDTFMNVSRYRMCRPQVTPELTVASSTMVKLRLTGTVNTALCTDPLSVTMPVTTMPHGQVHAYKNDGTDMPVKLFNGALVVDMKPGDEVNVEIVH